MHEEQKQALQDVKILDFSWSVVGPLTTKYFSDHGATVVKVESKQRIDVGRTYYPMAGNIPGIDRCGWFDMYATGKYSIGLNLNHPRGIELAKKAVAWADVVTESLNLHGIPLTISDTAGVQNSSDPVEIIGIQKTMEQVERCDLVLFLVEAQKPMTEEDLSIYDRIRHRPHVVIFNKIDLVGGGQFEAIAPSRMNSSPQLAISALNGDGLDHLKDKILELSGGEAPLDLNPVVIPNLRHKELLDRALGASEALCGDLEKVAPPELLAVHASEILQSIEEIMGISVKADILDRIFDQFCIGK